MHAHSSNYESRMLVRVTNPLTHVQFHQFDVDQHLRQSTNRPENLYIYLVTAMKARMLPTNVCTYTILTQGGARYGVSDSRTIAAERMCLSAHLTRYGPCTTPVMDTLIDAGVYVCLCVCVYVGGCECECGCGCGCSQTGHAQSP